ncbi:iron chaperone [Pedobacter sp. N23S346]|uniref:iron chaperone n=1 Tax=Pedobacter sp. N23S346 TaxID=3402750 RepID=UPI003AC4B6B8
MEKKEPKTIDSYIAQFPAETQKILKQIRKTIHLAAPAAKEVISYKMPAFKQNSILVYFAAYAKHIGFYPTGVGIDAFKSEFENYKWSKGAVQFPIDQELPLDLIARITKFKVEKDFEKVSKPKKIS